MNQLGAWAANTQTLLLLTVAGCRLHLLLDEPGGAQGKQDSWSMLLGVLNGIVLR
jgi:hypothetical protein